MLAQHGATGVEAAPTRIAPWDALDDAAVAQYRRQMGAAGLQVCSMQAILFGRPDLQLLGDAAGFAALTEHMRRVAAIGHGLGAGVAVLGAPRNRSRGAMTEDDAVALAAERLRVLGGILGAAGLVLGLEPVPAS